MSTKRPARKTAASAKQRPARKTAAKKTASRKKPVAERTYDDEVDAETLRELIILDAKRAPIRSAILMVSLLTTSIICISLVWWTLIFSQAQVRLAEQQNQRIVRLATTINTAALDILPRMSALENAVDDGARREDFVRNIIRFCILVQRSNAGFVCPSLAEMTQGPYAAPEREPPVKNVPAT